MAKCDTMKDMQKKHIHLIGIGGIGISALAQLYVHQGHVVSGTNDNESPQTLDRVRALGVPVSLSRDVADLPSDIDFFVYSDAWTGREPAFMASVRALGKPMFSYFEALGEATKEGKSVIVSGTHGKTTTTAMIAKILIDAGKEPTVVVGSILSEQGSNFVAGKPDFFVIEGCEYMRHFLHLHPHILVIGNIELDHTDYYKNEQDFEHAFVELIQKVPINGAVITNTDSASIQRVLLESEREAIPFQHATVPSLAVGESFNAANARAAKPATRALFPDITEEAVDASLASFRGTYRRFEYKGKTANGALVYDDYAHHPTEVEATLTMVRETFPEKKIVVVFHPHLYSRTRDFFDAFAGALARVDSTFILPIFAARELPIEGVTGEKLAEAITAQGGKGRYVGTFAEAEALLQEEDERTLILTMGAGDVYHVAEALVKK